MSERRAEPLAGEGRHPHADRTGREPGPRHPGLDEQIAQTVVDDYTRPAGG
ncbi:hypothetical protein [Streptomyces eurythermus]